MRKLHQSWNLADCAARSAGGVSGMARQEAMMSGVCGFTVITLLTGFIAGETMATKPEEREVKQQQQQLHASALNTALAFELYRDLVTRTTTEPGAQQQQQQRNILFSPLGLASALALLSRVTGAASQNQALEALGLAANSTEQSAEAISALTDLQRSLTLQEGRRGGVNGGAAIAAAAGGAMKGADAEEGRTAADDGVHAGGQLRLWSSLHVDGKPAPDYESFLSRPQHAAASTFNVSVDALKKDSQTSDKLILNNYVYFKGRQPFQRHHTVQRRFQLNATTSVEVPMMFRDDSSEVMMLYDTNCSATVVRLAHSKRLASLLLLPKAELQPLEGCVSNGRMNFWLDNLKPGRAEIRFPKFQLRKSYSLEKLLRNSAAAAVFTNSADFSGISSKRTMKLIKAPHVVLMEVEETTSEGGGRPDVTLDFTVPQRITFDRPFMFMIYDEVTGLVLIMGRIADPTDV